MSNTRPIAKAVSNFLAAKEVYDGSSTDIGGHLQHPDLVAASPSCSSEPELNAHLNLMDEGKPVAASPSCSLSSLDRCRGAPHGRDRWRIDCTVEPLGYDVVFFKNIWSTSRAIFSKGINDNMSNMFSTD